jgi:hypothetical protein
MKYFHFGITFVSQIYTLHPLIKRMQAIMNVKEPEKAGFLLSKRLIYLL